MTTMLTILTESYADWECGLLTAVGRSYYGFTTRSAAPGGQPLTSAGGLRVTPDLDLDSVDIAGFDAVLVCGGRAWESEDPPNLTPLLRQAVANDVVIGAICGAVRALAGAGMLDDIPHTGNNLAELQPVSGYRGSGHYVEQPTAIRAGRIVTAPGTAPVAFMAEVMDALGQDRSQLDYYVGLHAAQFRKAA